MSDPSQQQLVAIAINNYLTNPDRLTKEERSKSNKIIDHYAKTNEHSTVVNQIFSSLKKNLTKQNFTSVCKRFLILVDDILEVSRVKPVYEPYSKLISKQLVECFLNVFSLIFQYQLHQASLDWKVYRMLWAKSIDDKTFDALRQQILQKHRNFDLNRGFTQESIERIKKRYNRKGFTEQEVKRYMEGNRIQNRVSPKPELPRQQIKTIKKPERSESSSSNEHQLGRKKDPRINYIPQDRRQRQPSPYSAYNYQPPNPYQQPFRPETSYIPNQPVQQPMVPHPSMIHQIMQPPPPQHPQPRVGYPQPQNIYQPGYSSMSPYVPSTSPFPSPYRSPYRSPDRGNLTLINSKKSEPQTEVMSMDHYVLLRKKLLDGQHQCRQCGQLFTVRQNLNKHIEKHLIEAQRQLQNREYSKANDRQGNTAEDDKFNRLLTVKEWIEGYIDKEDQVPQQITIQNIPSLHGKYYCHFCQEQLPIKWCTILEDWALPQAIRAIEGNGKLTVAHFACFQEFVPQGEMNRNGRQVAVGHT